MSGNTIKFCDMNLSSALMPLGGNWFLKVVMGRGGQVDMKVPSPGKEGAREEDWQEKGRQFFLAK